MELVVLVVFAIKMFITKMLQYQVDSAGYSRFLGETLIALLHSVVS